MRYQLKPIFCRPWLLNGLSTRLSESHYENIYGGALRRLNAITEKLESLDFTKTPGYVINGLKREEVIALNSTLLHELYFASPGVAPVAKGRNIPRPAGALAEALVQEEFGDLPGVSVEEVKEMLDTGKPVQIIDARPRHSMSRQQDIMDGATWRDPDLVQEWSGELSKSDPVVVFCVYGFHVGCKTAIMLREAGFDAKYMKGGHSAWKAIGGAIKPIAEQSQENEV